MKHIGILAHSAEGSALCYMEACHAAARKLGEHMHPDITLSIMPMGPTLPLWEQHDLQAILPVFVKTADRLKAAGCDFFVCPDNTAHLALEAADEPLPLPGLHIAEVVASEAAKKGYSRIGLLGTKWTMEGSVYPDAFSRHGQAFAVPPTADRELVDQVIFDELCNGVFAEASRKEYIRIINDLASLGCDAVVLGCTEIPLLISPEDSPVPTLDSTRLLATAAVDVALGKRPMPEWAGGPV